MLETIKNVFLGFIDLVTSLIDFVVGFIQDIVYVVQLTASFVVKIPQLLSWLPSSIVTLFVILFAIVVIYKILGREG